MLSQHGQVPAPPLMSTQPEQAQLSVWRDIVTDTRHRLPIGLFKVIDLVLVMFSFGIATILIVRVEHKITLVQFLSMRTKIWNFFIFGLALLICQLVFSICGLYVSRRLSSRHAEFADLLKAITFSVACFVVLGWLFSIQMITMPFLAAFWAIGLAVLSGFRLILRTVLAKLRARGRNLRHMLILGTNSRAVAFARKVLAAKERGYNLVGFVDDDWPGLTEFRQTEFQLVSNCSRLKEFLRENVVDEVTIFLPIGSFYTHCNDVANLCRHHGIVVRFNSDIFGIKSLQRRAEEFDGDHFIATFTSAGEGWPVAIKRALDVLVSTLLMLLLSPILITAAIAIKLTSPGPVFFVQDRIGLNKRKFRICKLRTMVRDAEKLQAGLELQNEVLGPVFKIREDPRITPIGRFLRRSSIDELPQLFNVLKGDMSLVGPRPLPLRDYAGFNEDWQRRRFSVKPGITCLWQVNGRSTVSFDQWMLLDLQYMDEWSLWLDLKILAKTVPAVLRGAGAA
jgi:exopolysaccharide biosynthesis polyprenyl glycosylphosphotransferase